MRQRKEEREEEITREREREMDGEQMLCEYGGVGAFKCKQKHYIVCVQPTLNFGYYIH